MLVQSEAIVLNATKYSENSIISKVFSKEKGNISLIWSRTKGKKNKQPNYFQPLNAIEVVCYSSKNSPLHRVKEISFNNRLNPYSEHVTQNAVRFFLAEFLNKIIKEEEQNLPLYHFFENKLLEFNNKSTLLNAFHINFLIDLLNELGFKPQLNSAYNYIDFREGRSTSIKPEHKNYCSGEASRIFMDAFLGVEPKTKNNRRLLLNLLIDYYNVQYGGGLENLKSKAIFEEVFY